MFLRDLLGRKLPNKPAWYLLNSSFFSTEWDKLLSGRKPTLQKHWGKPWLIDVFWEQSEIKLNANMWFLASCNWRRILVEHFHFCLLSNAAKYIQGLNLWYLWKNSLISIIRYILSYNIHVFCLIQAFGKPGSDKGYGEGNMRGMPRKLLFTYFWKM